MIAIIKRNKISIVADDNFASDIWATDPISDKKLVFNWLFKIVEKMFGDYSHANLLAMPGRGIEVKRETEGGFLWL